MSKSESLKVKEEVNCKLQESTKQSFGNKIFSSETKILLPCCVNMGFAARPRGYKKLFSCSTQLSMQYIMLIISKIPSIVGF